MKICKPTGTIKTADAAAAGMKVGRDIGKLDANRDGVLTRAEVAAGERRLKLDAPERKLISQVLANSLQEHGGASVWAATIACPYTVERLGSLDTSTQRTFNARQLSKMTVPPHEGRHGIDAVSKRLAPDFFEYVQAEERAGKKI